jgi:hypothetical protein
LGFSNDLTQILHFYDYVPFEEDLTLYLYSFEFPLHFCDYLPFEEDLALFSYGIEFLLPNDDLYQV